MTPLGLLRAGNSIEAVLFEKIIKCGRREDHPHRSQGRAEVAVKMWHCFGNTAANRTHTLLEEAQSSLHRAAEMGKCPQGTLNPRACSRLPVGTHCPARHLRSALLQQPPPLLHERQLPLPCFFSASTREAVWDIFSFPFTVPKARRFVAQRTHRTTVS